MLLLTVAMAFISAVTSANAQSSSSVRANIPFDFTIGDKTLPAGTYTAQRISLSVMAVRSADGQSCALRSSNNVEPKRGQAQARLVFHKYGNQYFLAEVWTGVDGRELITSKAERAIEREMHRIAKNPSPSETAQNASASETVTIIASLQ